MSSPKKTHCKRGHEFTPENTMPGKRAKECRACSREHKRLFMQSVRSANPLYATWVGMLSRCHNPKVPYYERYGGRGITVCERWLTYANFESDMGPRPTDRHQIDRINNDGNYEPGNCRWATAKEQARNRSSTRVSEVAALCIRVLSARGASRRVLAEAFGVHYSSIARITTGKSWL